MMSTILWDNRAEFDTEFGANTAAARAVIDQALLDWGAAIDSFNYRNVGQSGWAPHPFYVFNLDVRDLQAGTLAQAKPIGIEKDGKPFSGFMTIDVNADNGGWYFDPSPWNDYEFSNPVTPFASSGGPNGYDLYSTVLHELGHALGIAGNPKLAFHSHITNNIFTFNDGTQAVLNDSSHAHTKATEHPNDLMTPSVSQSERRTISDLDARLLGEGFGYSIDLRQVYKRTFVTTYNTTDRTLTIHGDLGTTFNTVDDSDDINLNVTASDVIVDVNGYR